MTLSPTLTFGATGSGGTLKNARWGMAAENCLEAMFGLGLTYYDT